jgi:hypothetical protein
MSAFPVNRQVNMLFERTSKLTPAARDTQHFAEGELPSDDFSKSLPIPLAEGVAINLPRKLKSAMGTKPSKLNEIGIMRSPSCYRAADRQPNDTGSTTPGFSLGSRQGEPSDLGSQTYRDQARRAVPDHHPNRPFDVTIPTVENIRLTVQGIERTA